MASDRHHSGAAERKPAQYGSMIVRRQVAYALTGLFLLAFLPSLLWLAFDVSAVVILTLEVVSIAAMFLLNDPVSRTIGYRMRGNEGERQVGAILDGMASENWLTLHDIDTGRGNIDHLVIGPGGLFTVETKSRTRRVRVASIDRAWLNQAYAQRKWIETITGMKAESLLVFSQAYVDRTPCRVRGVMVLPARMLAGYLERHVQTLTAEQVQAIHQRLAAALDARASLTN
ncbi:MAG TPA: nuclease-related domain-containing protein [Solirubrobacteraceae bacterium]